MVQVVTRDNLGTDFQLGVEVANKINVVPATETVKGKMRFATNAEAAAGAHTDSAITPAQLAAAIAGVAAGQTITAATTPPASPSVGDRWYNTDTVTVSGVPPSAWSTWTGSIWSVDTNQAGAGSAFTQTVTPPASPAPGDRWQNTSAAPVSGVPAGAVATWDGSGWAVDTNQGTPTTITAATTPPSSPSFGDRWYNTDTVTVSGVPTASWATWNGSAWKVDTNQGTATAVTAATTPPATPSLGDRWYNTDTVTVSGVPAASWATWDGSAWKVDTNTGVGGPLAIDDLTDVDTTTTAPTVGDRLTWDGTNWVPSGILMSTAQAVTVTSTKSVASNAAVFTKFDGAMTEVRDDLGVTPSAGDLTVPADGWYMISGYVYAPGLSTGANIPIIATARALVNGAPVIANSEFIFNDVAWAPSVFVPFSVTEYLVAGDVVSFEGLQSSGTSPVTMSLRATVVRIP